MADHKNLFAALAAFQAELPAIIKDNTAKVDGKDGKRGYTYEYADLAAVAEACLPKLGAQGLAFMSRPTMAHIDIGGPRTWVLHCTLVHESGESEHSYWPLTGSLAMQQKGSEITYARRYSMMAFLGVFPQGEDDDGKSAADSQKASPGRYSLQDSWDDAKPAKPAQNPPPAQAAAEQKALEQSVAKAQAAAKPVPTDTIPQSIVNNFVQRCAEATPEDIKPTGDGPAEIVAAYNSLLNDFAPGQVSRSPNATTTVNMDDGSTVQVTYTGDLDTSTSPRAAWMDYLYDLTRAAGHEDADPAVWGRPELTYLWNAVQATGLLPVKTEAGETFKVLLEKAITQWKAKTEGAIPA